MASFLFCAQPMISFRARSEYAVGMLAPASFTLGGCMTHSLDRRHFLGTAASTGLALGLAPTLSTAADQSGSDRVVVGIMGTGGRGQSLASTFQKQKGVEVAYVCDVDKRRTEQAVEVVNKISGKPPKGVGDFRRILDDRNVHALVVATCNHWHAPAAILACAAGKHVYVEKPCSHNPREGELMVEAARKHKRCVQLGTQRRSRTKLQEAIGLLREGAIGRVYLARCWYNNHRPGLGIGKVIAPPDWLDYALWQGPAPARPLKDNVIHYNWHWFWHWGNGELGNNGVHSLDICRWGLGVDYPIRVTSSGGRYHFQDDQETPDTHNVAFDFPGRRSITWQGLSCVHTPGETGAEEAFFGDKGSMVLTGTGYIIYDLKGKEIKKVTGTASDAEHVGNFLAGIREGKALNAEIEEGYKSTLLCHLGNIAQRLGRSLRCDPSNGHILDDKQAMALWSREYAKGWEPKV